MIPLLMLKTVLRMEKGKVLGETHLYCFPYLNPHYPSSPPGVVQNRAAKLAPSSSLVLMRRTPSQLAGLIQLLSMPSTHQINWWRWPGRPHLIPVLFSFLTTLFPGQNFLGLGGGEHRYKVSFKSCLMPYYLDLCFLNLRTVVFMGWFALDNSLPG